MPILGTKLRAAPPGTRARRAARGVVLTCALLACGGESGPATGRAVPDAPSPPHGRALWVLAEGHQRVLDHPERIPDLIADAHAMGASDLFVQVYRGGRAWYEATLADAAPYRAVREASGIDSLAELLLQAHAADLRVHAWVNVLALSRNREAPILRALGDDAVVADRHERSLLDYPNHEVPEPDRRYLRMGTPGIYLDPAHPGLAAHLAAAFAELLLRYPTLDGLHLDYARYPDVLPFAPGTRFGVGLDFGYGPRSRARFEQETGLGAPVGDSLRNASQWDAWRRDRVTEVVREIAVRARSALPDVTISAAVWTYANRAYLSLGQDWRAWLEEDLVDFAVPMAYTLDDRLLRYQVEHFAGLPDANRIWIGLGTWLFDENPERAIEQVRIAREAGAVAEALFSYDSIVAAPRLKAALVEGLPR